MIVSLFTDRQIKEMKWPDLVTFFIFYFLFTQLLKQNNSQGGARAAALQARSFDLVRTGVAPPLVQFNRWQWQQR